jgi:hypothetical protein
MMTEKFKAELDGDGQGYCVIVKLAGPDFTAKPSESVNPWMVFSSTFTV